MDFSLSKLEHGVLTAFILFPVFEATYLPDSFFRTCLVLRVALNITYPLCSLLLYLFSLLLKIKNNFALNINVSSDFKKNGVYLL